MTALLSRENPRKIRAFGIVAQANTIHQVRAQKFEVKSQSGNGEYAVTYGRRRACTCPDHEYRHVVCKHILAVEFWLALKRKIENADVFEIHREIVDSPVCRFCKSDDIIRRGSRKNKTGAVPRFLCKSCGKFFVADQGFVQMHVDPKIIALGLDLYFKGVSMRKISDHIKQFYGLRVSQVAVYRWARKYGSLIDEYADQLEPKLSDLWHADEKTLNVNGKLRWVWNLMDSQTRYLIASQLSAKRETEDARQLFAKGKEVAGKEPKAIVTDGLHGYGEGFNLVFWKRSLDRPRHLRMAGLRKKKNNNLVERLHGTQRERDKVMRGLDNDRSAPAFVRGYRAYYNLVRQHQALGGMTPAEVAGIERETGPNRWLPLIRIASQNHAPKR